MKEKCLTLSVTNLLLRQGTKKPISTLEISDDNHNESHAAPVPARSRHFKPHESTTKVTNTHTEMVVEAVKSIGGQVASAAQEGESTLIIPELFKVMERIEARISELNTRVRKLEVLVELLIKK